MDDTSGGSRTPTLDLTEPSGAPARRRLSRVQVGAAVGAVGVLLAVAACSGGLDGSPNSGLNPAKDAAASAVRDGVALQSGAFRAVPTGGSAAQSQSYVPHAPVSQGETLNGVSQAAFDRQQIKTAHIGIRSTTIQSVTASIESVADSLGGFVSSANTVTNVKGVATSSTVTVRIPVANFDPALDQLSQLGRVYDRRVSTQDVTGRVADVDSRVTSARDSIAQLRVLFSHATKLSDIITLESELSDREADLEALLAQQRALTNQTTLSTVSVQVARPPVVIANTKTHDDDEATGFVGGLKQGWNALADTFIAVSHGLGAALPLGLTILVIAGLLWTLVRRLPRRRVDTSG